MSNQNKMLLIYASKCVIGILLCYTVSLFLYRWIDYPWSLLSVVLVLSPEGKDAVQLALTRIKANVVGAGIGFMILASQIPTPWNIASGAAISLFVCDRLKLNEGARSTLAAMIIILLHQEGTHLWDSALSRVSAVFVGCLLGLVITYVFHALIKTEAPALNSESEKKGKEG
ncbi:MAG TPA: FUSC family protein [Cyclobacteriaceae bacterium]|nr:FUSC family protein [Cyclobacteriaceae bacterium]